MLFCVTSTVLKDFCVCVDVHSGIHLYHFVSCDTWLWMRPTNCLISTIVNGCTSYSLLLQLIKIQAVGV